MAMPDETIATRPLAYPRDVRSCTLGYLIAALLSNGARLNIQARPTQMNSQNE